jgi:hypothetical protein
LHTQWELAGEVLGTRQIGELLGLRLDAMHVAISRGDWHRVPRPSGRLGNFYYWWRSEFVAWRSA